MRRVSSTPFLPPDVNHPQSPLSSPRPVSPPFFPPDLNQENSPVTSPRGPFGSGGGGRAG